MVQIIPAVEKRPNFMQRLGSDLQQASAQMAHNQKLQELTGQNLAGLSPEFQQIAFDASLKNQAQGAKLRGEQQAAASQLRFLEQERGLEPGSLSAFGSDVSLAERTTRPKKTATREQPVPKEVASKMREIIEQNPGASADQISLLADESDIPPIYADRYIENRRRSEEQQTKTAESRRQTLRAETLPIRTDLAKKAEAAEKGIQNKQQLLDIIDKGDINDPTFAALAEALPLNLGKRLLSNDTVEYKAGLVEEFTDLRNIFQGQTRIKEIDLLENKIADIYLDDEQKKSVIRSRINALKADVIRAEAAAELEDQELGVLQFEKEVQKRAKPKLNALLDQILGEHKAVIDAAEKKKNLPLDPRDPEDLNILQQILKEAGGDKQKAREIATKKGYKF